MPTFLEITSPGTQTHCIHPTPIPMSISLKSAHLSVQPKSVHVDPMNDETTNLSGHNQWIMRCRDSQIPHGHINSSIPILAHLNPSSGEPDPFDGSNPRKLHTFIFQCSWILGTARTFFNNEETKVNYTLSIWRGSHWIVRTCSLDLHDPVWLSKFQSLGIKTIQNFHPQRQSGRELEAFHMHENHQATKYSLNFSSYPHSPVGVIQALWWQAYNGLAKCIQRWYGPLQQA